MKAFKKSKYFGGFVCCSETEISAEGECGLVVFFFHLLFRDVYHLMRTL